MVAEVTPNMRSFRCECSSKIIVTTETRPSCTAVEPGEVCPRPPVAEAAELRLMLCRDHFHIVLGLLADYLKEMDLDQARQDGALLSLAIGREIRRQWREAQEARDRRATWYVYYVRIGDSIKIGTTGNLEQRMSQLMADEILAAEPGDRDLERARHRQFAHLRVRGERFRPANDLMTHVEDIRHRFGLPAGSMQIG